VAITLHKRIPVAAGLGGGSGDAAAVLRALAELWDVGADRQQELLRIALSLGADVPVCLHGSAAYVGGIGEVLSEPPKLPGSAVLLINPGVAVPTGPVFAAREGPFSTTNRFSESPQNAQELAAALAARHNDLERPARAQVPVIAQVLDRLNAESGCLLSRMTGSGGTCFGLFEDDIATQRAADAIAQEKPAWWVCPTRLAHN
jgi:4-diphosphocytidyl-2-C-methyl-D-erythritol kinase